MTSTDAIAPAPSSSLVPRLAPDPRLEQLKAELHDHSRMGRYLGVDFQRAIGALADGYPETAVTQVGKITERLLKRLWIHHGASGSPSGKTLQDLIRGCRPYIRSQRVLDALHDIQRLRNRASHDGYPVAAEDALFAIRRLLDVLDWYTSTGSGALTRNAPRLAPAAAAKAEWIAGLYLTLDYRLAIRRELSQHAVYLLFTRVRGLRTEHAELLICPDAAAADQVLAAAGPDLLQTRLSALTGVLVVDHHDGIRPALLPSGYQVLTYERFMDTCVHLDRYLADLAAMYPALRPATVPVEGDMLSSDDRTGEMTVSSAGNARDLLSRLASDGGNLLVIGPPGTGKTTLLKQLVVAQSAADARLYRFFFDLSLQKRAESFADFVTRTLVPYMRVESAYVFPAFCYFARAGSVLCALDGFDEAVPDITPAGLLSLFTEVAEVLSAESAVVMTSRVSFLQDSPQTRSLLDGTRLMSEKLGQLLHARGVDPQRLPRFSVLRLHAPASESLLAAELHQQDTQAPGRKHPAQPVPPYVADLLWGHLLKVAGPELLPKVVNFFGLAFLRGITVFSLIELVNELGIGVFDGGHVAITTFRLRDLFRTADPDATALALRHVAYQELLAAEYLRCQAHRDITLTATAHPRLTEEVRAFLCCRAQPADPVTGSTGSGEHCVVPAGVYLVGPGHHLMLRRVDKPVRLDEFPVTVARYKRFLDRVHRLGSAQWDHPRTPAGHSHDPRPDRLPVLGYYSDPAYDNYPAVGVTWWSAYSLARSEGKRLPTSLEWEAAARGFDGRLFPWGDDVDIAAVNCADSWSGRPLVTYAAWRAEYDHGRLGRALPSPVDAHPRNLSPFGVRDLAGNVWEWTSTRLDEADEAVVCGGSRISSVKS
jgi:Sulfatase-modifying factor enzyme 1/NACHT domain